MTEIRTLKYDGIEERMTFPRWENPDEEFVLVPKADVEAARISLANLEAQNLALIERNERLEFREMELREALGELREASIAEEDTKDKYRAVSTNAMADSWTAAMKRLRLARSRAVELLAKAPCRQAERMCIGSGDPGRPHYFVPASQNQRTGESDGR